MNHELISEAEFRDIHVRFVKEIKKLDKDDKKNAIVVIRDIIAACNEEKLARCSSAGYWIVTEDDETNRLYEAPRNKIINRVAL